MVFSWGKSIEGDVMPIGGSTLLRLSIVESDGPLQPANIIVVVIIRGKNVARRVPGIRILGLA